MEMNINTDLIKVQRSNRAWSQTQLADVSGLSLRTIQRIEKTGIASLESVKSLASVFEIEIKELQQKPLKNTYSFKANLAAFFGLIGIILSALIAIPATAQPIMVNLQLSSKGIELSNVQILNEENSESEMVVSNILKVTFTSTRKENGMVNISTNLFDLSTGKEILISSPSIITKHRETAEIHFGDFFLSLTPHL